MAMENATLRDLMSTQSEIMTSEIESLTAQLKECKGLRDMENDSSASAGGDGFKANAFYSKAKGEEEEEDAASVVEGEEEGGDQQGQEEEEEQEDAKSLRRQLDMSELARSGLIMELEAATTAAATAATAAATAADAAAAAAAAEPPAAAEDPAENEELEAGRALNAELLKKVADLEADLKAAEATAEFEDECRRGEQEEATAREAELQQEMTTLRGDVESLRASLAEREVEAGRLEGVKANMSARIITQAGLARGVESQMVSVEEARGEGRTAIVAALAQEKESMAADASAILQRIAAHREAEEARLVGEKAKVTEAQAKTLRLEREKRQLVESLHAAKGNIRVLCRIRPNVGKEVEDGVETAVSIPFENKVSVEMTKQSATTGAVTKTDKVFEFDRVRSLHDRVLKR